MTQKPTNLRGQRVSFALDGKAYRGKVITRIRDTRWLIECGALPDSYRRSNGVRRIVLDRSSFAIVQPSAPAVRGARSPLERMIDAACGLEPK